MTEQQVLSKLTALCAKSEHCKEEMLIKMRKWDIDMETQRRVIDYLVNEKYIDEERYARFFINDKVKYNHWGRKKVEQALYMKHISREISDPIFNEMSSSSFEEILLPLLQNKNKSIKADSDYERRGKLIRFALGRGFTMDEALQCIEKIIHNF